MAVIGSWSISNVASMNLYEVAHGINDSVLIGLNNITPTWYDIKTDADGRSYVRKGTTKYYLDECMRVN